MNSLAVLTIVVASVLVQTFGFRILPRPHPRLDGRIVGGENANIANIPYQLSLQDSFGHFCGASLISDQFAVTAAHCADSDEMSSLKVLGGSNYTNGVGGHVVDVKRVIQHPDYDSFTTDYDVSVLHLKSKPTDASIVHLISKGAGVTEGALALVSGWGALSSGGSSPEHLQQVQVAHVSQNDCRDAYNGIITLRMTCYASSGKDSCQGDSGGPLVYEGELVGIVSWGYGCADPECPGVYCSVANTEIHDFITGNMK